MGYLGYKPADKPLTSADITDSIITSAKIVDGTIANADINSSAAIAKTKLNLTGTIGISDLSATGTASSTTFLRGDNTWGSAGATAGQVIQVVSATDSTSRSSTSSTYVTGSNTLSVSITPSSTSNKIFVLYTGAIQNVNVANATSFFTIYRNGSTNLGAGSNSALGSAYIAANNLVVNMAIGYLDSPSTTSSTTYQVYFKNDSATTVYLNAQGTLSSITAFEVKG